MRHYRFKLLFLAMLCYSGHAFGQTATQWLDAGQNRSSGLYYGAYISLECDTYGSSVMGYFPVSASVFYSCGYPVYGSASATVSYYGGYSPDMVSANSELADNSTDPGFDYGYEALWTADGDGYQEGDGWVFYPCAWVYGSSGP